MSKILHNSLIIWLVPLFLYVDSSILVIENFFIESIIFSIVESSKESVFLNNFCKIFKITKEIKVTRKCVLIFCSFDKLTGRAFRFVF